MTTTLIISPDYEWSTKAQGHLIAQGIPCDIVQNGKEAQLKAYHSSYDYFFLDLEVKNNSGIEVMKYLRNTKPLSQIFITISSPEKLEELLISEKSLLKLGVRKVLYKPHHDSLMNEMHSLGKIKTWESVKENSGGTSEPEGETEIGDGEFTRVKIHEVQLDVLAVFDYYLRLRSNRYIKIVHKGEKPSAEQLENYFSQGVDYIYFKKCDRAAFVSYQNHLAKETLQNSPQDTVKVIKMIKSASDKYFEEVVTAGLKPSLIEEGKAICQNMYDAAKQDKGLKKFLSDFEQFNPEEFSHSFLVSFFSTVICKGLPWVGEKSLNALALGALFHDIGILQLPEHIREKDYALLSPEDKILYNTHPSLGVEALKGVPGINTAVLQIIEQHEECVNGSGYPLGKSGNNIYPLAKVVSLADHFAYYVKDSGQTPKACLKSFLLVPENLPKFDQELIRNLIKAF